MNRQQARGQLLQITGVLREHWGRVISDQTMQIRGERERVVGKSQAREGALRVFLFSRQQNGKTRARV
jgi:uncharacterized protein YjbJ (UPF0337 family)